MTDALTQQSILCTGRAELILEALRRRAPTDADLQASAMVVAGIRLLQEVRGTPAVLDALSRSSAALVGEVSAVSHPSEVAPAATPEIDARELYAIVMARPPAEGRVQADAMMSAGTAFLIAREGADAAVAALGQLTERVRASRANRAPAPAVVPEQNRPEDIPDADVPERLAAAIVEQLRGLDRGEAHDCARAVVAGAATYLHEVHGRTYASAVLAGTLDAAAACGDEVRGGRDTLH